MLQPSLDTALQKINLKNMKIENQNFNKVFVPHPCHSTLFVRHLILLHQCFFISKHQQYYVRVNYFSTIE